MAIYKEVYRSVDGYEAYIVTSAEGVNVRKVCVEAENNLVFGRILDIDVMDKSGVQIGREELCIPPRKCFVCDKSAAYYVNIKVRGFAVHQGKQKIICKII
ncbi:citrate lyase holo-[acyl-carrier protein] synthase [Petroclostridium sp. X23]|uniref:citrate lyase holo-[acyl-carrier protein] synthase n=1 Tax=Petroclostridium sp. X23 TaxID=3045146 RepID=UPI0024AD33E8|nr:citrate lyase holo-[acyl-carrier protein] synthase [Petroclostridium sp. X23]WHH57842.1 citrate lyase holo-[acyl-carrier protein] synthase [Petroclostridium sp. X23]